MTTRATSFSIAGLTLIFIMAVGVWLTPSSFAAPVCQDVQIQADGNSCPSGQVCIRGGAVGTCVNYDIQTQGVTMTSSSISTQVQSIAERPQTISVSSCLGPLATCQTPTLQPSLWTSNGSGTLVTATQSGLRPSRTYSMSLFSSFNGTNATKEISGTTWPGYGFTPTDSDAGCDGATSLCKRNISWTTLFQGDSKVVYGVNPPTWTLETNPRDTTTNIAGLTSTANGNMWGVGWYAGKIIHRDPSGVWAAQPSSTTNTLMSVSSVDGVHVWAVGQFGTVISSQNGGQSWTTTNPFTAGSFTNVTATLATTAWAATDTDIYFFDGSAWKHKLNDPTASFQQVISIDNKEVWAVSYNGSIRHTINGYLDWGSATPPVWDTSTPNAGDRFTSVSTLDGKIVWAGGNNASNGKPILYRSQNGGAWTAITQIQSISGRVSNINQVDQDTFWFSNLVGVGKFEYNGGTPNISFYSDPSSQIGSDVLALAIDEDGHIFAAGQQQNISRFGMPSTSSSQLSLSLASTHTLLLSGLIQNTTYYYSAESRGSGVTLASLGSFTTPIVDTIKPTVTIAALPPAIKTCPVALSGTAADTAPGTVQSVRVIVDGTQVITATGTTSWSASLPCSIITPGSHTVVAVSNDGTNDSDPASITFVFDTTAPTVTITAPTPVTTPTVTATGTARDTLDQVAKVEVLVNGTGSRINVPITAGPTVNWSLSGINLNPGVNTIVAYATDRAGNEGSAATNVTYNVPTFSVVPDAPTSQTIPAGSSAIFPVKISAISGFNGTVSMSASATPPGLTPLFTPTTVSLASQPSDYTSMIVPTTAGGASGPYTITITGTSGSITKTAQVTLTLTATPDFTLSANPASRTVVAGTPALYDLIVSGSSTYATPAGGISWSTNALPSGVTASFGAMSGRPDSGGTGTVKLTLNTTQAVPAGTSITITATDGVVTHTVTVGLTATPPPDFTLSIAPASAATVAGSGNSAAYNLTVTSVNGFGGVVHLALSSNPSDTAIKSVFSQNDFTPTTTGDVVTINVTADNTIQCAPVPPPPATPSPCDYSLTITGTSGTPPTITRTASATLSVTPDTTPPVITGAAASASDTNVTISWTTNEAANSRFDLYADAARTTLIGFKEAATTYCLSGCHVLSYDPVLTPLTTYYYTITSADQAYPGGNSTTLTADANGPLKFTTQAAPDNIPPVIVIDSPAGGTSVRGLVTISGHASDNNPMSQVKITVTGPSGATGLPNNTVNCTSGNNCPFSQSWNTMNGTTPNGDYTVTVVAISSTGPAFTATDAHTFTVDNDTTPPTIECLSGQTVCEPVAINLTCTNGSCSVTIHWRTNEDSTSEVEYGLAVDCSQQVQRPDGTFVSCAYTNAKRYDDNNDNPAGSLPNYTDHNVTLTNLSPDQLYHYRVTSCNISNLCTN